MQRRIAQQVELCERLQIGRVEFSGLRDEALPRHQRRPTERCTAQNLEQEVLRQQIGGAVAVDRAVGDGRCAQHAGRALREVVLADRQRQREGDRVVELAAVAAFERGDRAGSDLPRDRLARQRHRLGSSGVLAVELRISLPTMAVDEVHERRVAPVGSRGEAACRLCGARRRRQHQRLRLAKDVEHAERRRRLPGGGRQSEVVRELGDLARAVRGSVLDQVDQVCRVGRSGQVRQATDHARRPLEARHLAAVRRIAGVRQITPGGDIGVGRRLEDGVGEVLHRHHVGGAQDQQVVGVDGAEHRIDRGLELARAGGVGDGRCAELGHRRGVVEEHQPSLQPALAICGSERAQGSANARETAACVLATQRAAVSDDELVVQHGLRGRRPLWPRGARFWTPQRCAGRGASCFNPRPRRRNPEFPRGS